MNTALSDQKQAIVKTLVLTKGNTVAEGDEYYDPFGDGEWSPVPESFVGTTYNPNNHPPVRTQNENYSQVSYDAYEAYESFKESGRGTYILDMWYALGQAVDSNGNLTVWFLHFPPGTEDRDVWDWMENELGADPHELTYGIM